MKIKSLKIILFVILIFKLTSCGSISNNNSSNTSDNQLDRVTESLEQDHDQKNILSKKVRFMGNVVSMPFKFKDLKKIDIDKNTTFDCSESNVFGAIYYDQYRLGRVILDDCQTDDNDFINSEVVYLKINPDLTFDEFDFEYMGLSFSSSKEDVINTLGKPDEDKETIISYIIDSDTTLKFKFEDSLDKLMYFNIYTYEFKE